MIKIAGLQSPEPSVLNYFIYHKRNEYHINA